jgi:hypothetical protein
MRSLFLALAIATAMPLSAGDAWWSRYVDANKIKHVLPELLEIVACTPLLKGRTRRIIHTCFFVYKAGVVYTKLRADGPDGQPTEEVKSFEELGPGMRMNFLGQLLNLDDNVGPVVALSIYTQTSVYADHIEGLEEYASMIRDESKRREIVQIMLMSAYMRSKDFQKAANYLLSDQAPVRETALKYLASRWNGKSLSLEEAALEILDFKAKLAAESRDAVLDVLVKSPEISGDRVVNFLFTQYKPSRLSQSLGLNIYLRVMGFIQECGDALAEEWRK